MYKSNWKDMNYPSRKHDWIKFEKDNPSVALNVLDAGKEKIYPAHVSKHVLTMCQNKTQSMKNNLFL